MPRTRISCATTNSQGQTQEQVEAEEQSRIADDHQNPPNDDHHNQFRPCNNLDIECELMMTKPLMIYLAAAQASNSSCTFSSV
jgi:hypothetical protein